MCGGINSFSASNNKGALRWNCFRISCKAKGTGSHELTLTDVKDFLFHEEEVKAPLELTNCAGWKQDIKSYPRVWEYLETNNCQSAYEASPNKFWYDAPNDRVVFVEYATPNSFKLATGRSLKNVKPKWYKYVALPNVYYTITNPASDTIYIVEDCASACSISRVGKSLALCGTNYNLHALIEVLLQEGAKKVVVCLDNDARLKALRLKTELASFGGFESVKVKFLRDDAKYLNLDYLKKELENG